MKDSSALYQMNADAVGKLFINNPRLTTEEHSKGSLDFEYMAIHEGIFTLLSCAPTTELWLFNSENSFVNLIQVIFMSLKRNIAYSGIGGLNACC